MYERIAYLLPKSYKQTLKQSLKYAGFEEKSTNKLAGFSFLFGFALAMITSFFLYLYGFGFFSLIGIFAGISFIVVIHVFLALIADSRARQIEAVLPDCLQLISANVRAGMTIDKAIWLSARPEFGILEEEIRKVGVKTLGGKSIKNALEGMCKRIKSQLLDRAVKLLIEGIEAGGELAHLLEEASSNIRISQSLRKEIQSSVMMYSILILFAAVFGAPLLFAVSLYFIEIMGGMWGTEIGIGEGMIGGMIKMTEPQISGEELFYFSLASIAVTTFFGSLIIGLIKHGEEKRGLKFVIPFMLLAILVFFITKFLMGAMFGGMVV